MSVIIATPKASNANSYVTLTRADEIMAQRLYTDVWDAVTGPTAYDYLINDPGSALQAGSTSIPVDGGSGTFTAGTLVRFENDTTDYRVLAQLTKPGNLAISPGLVAVPSDNSAVTRITANDKEKALIWTTYLFDSMMNWNGWKTTEDQSLRWPRSGVIDKDGYSIDQDTIPINLERATAEEALILLSSNKFQFPSILGQGISEAKLGPLSVKVGSMQVEEVIPQNVLSLLDELGHLEAAAQTGARILPLWRS